MSRRAYAFLEIKSVDEERREISGWASRPETDRMGDIVEPLGMERRGTTPLLLDHDHKRAVGTVTALTPSRDGVRFTAKLAKIAQEGPLKQLVDDAWAMVRSGLRAATSIGFRVLEAEPLREGGLRFLRWEILELSLVSVPAAPGATIDHVKRYDQALLSKRQPVRVVRLDRPVQSAVEIELDSNEPTPKGLRPTDAMFARSIGAIAKTTDDCLSQLAERVTRLESGQRKSVVDMDADEFAAHMEAMQKRLGIQL